MKRQLERLLQGSLGLNIYPRVAWLERRLPRRPGLAPGALRAGVQMAAIYYLFFGILPLVVFALAGGIPPSLWLLSVLQLYGALWSGWATTSTRLADRAIMDVVERDLLPALSANALTYVRHEISRRYTRPKARTKLFLGSWALGAGAAALATFLVRDDLSRSFALPPLGVLWWWLGWTLLYTTAAKVVNVSRFYEIFAAALARDEQALFWPNAAASSAIASTALVGKRMLLFWLSIAISIALILPFGVYVGGLVGLEHLTPLGIRGARFVTAHLIGTAIFSMGVGSIIFLRSEAGLRRSAIAASAAALRSIEAEVESLEDRTWLAALDNDRLEKLRSLHEEVASGASYRTFLLSGLSVIIPFVPLLTLLLRARLGG